MMNELGMAETARLVSSAVESGYFKMPKTFAAGVPEPWDL